MYRGPTEIYGYVSRDDRKMWYFIDGRQEDVLM
jgi:hypothetical protein